MKYYARVGENEYEIEITPEELFVDGTAIRVDLKQSGMTELYSMLFDGTSHELLIGSDRFNYNVTLYGEQFQIQVEDERSRRLNAGRQMSSDLSGKAAVNAPIPGLVVKVLVEEGQEVEEGLPLIILEAMKMENEIRAPRSGIVTQIEVAPGQRVEQNSVLILLE
ncbi:MAG: DUF2118 domain-containing protein [Chloroflexota bacterium]